MKKKIFKKKIRGFAWRKLGKKRPILLFFACFWPFEKFWKPQNAQKLHKTWKMLDFIEILKEIHVVTSSHGLFSVSGGKNCYFSPFFPFFDHLTPIKSSWMLKNSKKNWKTLNFTITIIRFRLWRHYCTFFRVSGGKNGYFYLFFTYFDQSISVKCSKMSKNSKKSSKCLTLIKSKKSF